MTYGAGHVGAGGRGEIRTIMTGRYHFEDQVVDGRIIFKCNSGKQGWRM
jgi:hypothetical protein